MRWQLFPLLVLAAVGCAPAESVPKKDGRPAPAPVVPLVGDSVEKQHADQIAWNKRAADLLSKVVDKKSADAHSAALVALVQEREALNARTRGNKPWEWSQEKKDSLQKRFGDELKASSSIYIEAARPFSNYSTRKDLVPYVIEKYGVDIGRMKTIEKKSG